MLMVPLPPRGAGSAELPVPPDLGLSMDLVTDFEALAAARIPKPYVTWGVFDGVHLGHQQVLRALVDWAAAAGGTPVVITFSEHPREVLDGRAVPHITSLVHRLALLERCGIRACAAVHFDRAFAGVPARTFVRDVLVGRVGVRGIVLGAGATFGCGREGNLERLRIWAHEDGFEVRELVPLASPAGAISSTAIRKAVQAGDLDGAAVMLGRPFSLMAPVVHGDQRGRTLGFPTANLDTRELVLPPAGVYGCRTWIAGRAHDALTNIGTRPTFVGHDAQPRVEAHIIDFSGDLYGQDLELAFRFRIREERTFSGPDTLVEQIRRDRDVLRARRHE